jgi:hypothetical protein
MSIAEAMDLGRLRAFLIRFYNLDGDTFDCEHGHFDCSLSRGGACSNEVAARLVGEQVTPKTYKLVLYNDHGNEVHSWDVSRSMPKGYGWNLGMDAGKAGLIEELTKQMEDDDKII